MNAADGTIHRERRDTDVMTQRKTAADPGSPKRVAASAGLPRPAVLESLARSEAFHRAAIRAIPAVAAVLDARGRIVTVNDAWESFFVANGGEAGRCWPGEDYLKHCEGPTGSDADAAHRGLEAVLAGKLEHFEMEYPCHSLDEKRWFRFMATPLRLPHGGAVVVHIDITEVRVARDALAAANEGLELTVDERTQSLREALAELEMFSYSISHDLRGSLRTIAGLGDVLLEDHGAQLGPDGTQHAQQIADIAKRMATYLERLLKLSQLSRGELEVGEINVTAMARELAAEIAPRHGGRAIRLHIQEGLRVRGDPALLRAVFENLIENACKYTRDRDPALIEVGHTLRNGRDTLFVRDNGIGFDMALRYKLFLPFQRLHGDVRFEGHGLGMAAAARIVARHGGELDAESTPGEGAIFYVAIP